MADCASSEKKKVKKTISVMLRSCWFKIKLNSIMEFRIQTNTVTKNKNNAVWQAIADKTTALGEAVSQRQMV